MIMQNIYDLQPFAIMVVLLNKLFQPSHNCVIPTVKELSEIF